MGGVPEYVCLEEDAQERAKLNLTLALMCPKPHTDFDSVNLVSLELSMLDSYKPELEGVQLSVHMDARRDNKEI